MLAHAARWMTLRSQSVLTWRPLVDLPTSQMRCTCRGLRLERRFTSGQRRVPKKMLLQVLELAAARAGFRPVQRSRGRARAAVHVRADKRDLHTP